MVQAKWSLQHMYIQLFILFHTNSECPSVQGSLCIYPQEYDLVGTKCPDVYLLSENSIG